MELPLSTPNADIVKAIEATTEKLLVSYSCFDVFTDPSGEKLPADRKSIAYTFLYRDPARNPHGRGSGRRAPARAESPGGQGKGPFPSDNPRQRAARFMNRSARPLFSFPMHLTSLRHAGLAAARRILMMAAWFGLSVWAAGVVFYNVWGGAVRCGFTWRPWRAPSSSAESGPYSGAPPGACWPCCWRTTCAFLRQRTARNGSRP